jgi:hypothetical protein
VLPARLFLVLSSLLVCSHPFLAFFHFTLQFHFFLRELKQTSLSECTFRPSEDDFLQKQNLLSSSVPALEADATIHFWGLAPPPYGPGGAWCNPVE